MISRAKQSRAFTLIEIAVVLVLVAMLASVITVSSRGIMRTATIDETIAQIGSLDTQARAFAKQMGRPVELHIDTDKQQFVLKDSQQTRNAPLSSYAVPSGYELSGAWRMSDGERDQSDSMPVRYEADGSAATWGFVINPLDDEQQRQASAIVVLGLTGQLTVWENDGQAQDILAAALRHDAD